jgi:outer membrane protein
MKLRPWAFAFGVFFSFSFCHLEALGSPKQRRLTTVMPLTLKQAQDRASRRSFDIRIARLSFEIAEISNGVAFRSAFLPTLNISGSQSVTAQLIERDPQFQRTTNLPTSTAGLSLDYRIFNGFRDTNGFRIAQIGFQGSKIALRLAELSLEAQVTQAYMNYRLQLDQADAVFRSLRVAETLRKFTQNKFRLNQATQQDVDSAEFDRLQAELAVREQDGLVNVAKLDLNRVLSDSDDTEYKLLTPLEFAAVPADQVFDENQAPAIATARFGLESATIGLETAQQSRLPLPTVNMTLFSLAGTHGYTASNERISNNLRSIDAGVGVSLSWEIFGPGGFIQSASVAQAIRSEALSRIDFNRTQLATRTQMLSAIASLRALEKQITSQEQSVVESSKVLSQVVRSIAEKRFNRVDVRDAIERARQTEVSWKRLIFQHISAKAQLALITGVKTR